MSELLALPHQQRTGDPVADPHGIALRSVRDRFDGRGVGPAINCRLKPLGPQCPSIAVVLTRSRARSG